MENAHCQSRPLKETEEAVASGRHRLSKFSAVFGQKVLVSISCLGNGY